MAREQESPGTHYALLVGVNFYPKSCNEWCCLQGAVPDVRNMKGYLTKSLTQVDVQTLTATCSDLDPSRPTEDAKDLANHQNVVERLEDITLRAPTGSFIYIHFSTHGTAIEPHSEFSNGSTGDFALVLLDGDSGFNVRYLRGLELAFQLKNMVDKGLKVTLVLDCCTSGSVLRDRPDPSIRYLPYSLSVDKAYPPLPGKTLGLEDTAVQPVYRDGSMHPNWLVNPDGYTILTACGPTEEAKEIEVTGQHHGVLTYLLLRCFEEYGRIGGRQHHVYSQLRARFRDPKFRAQLGKQTPMLYGNKRLSFFEDASHEFEAIAVPICRSQGTIQLSAGQAHCVSEGDKFVLHPQSATRQTSTGSGDEVFLEVTRAEELVSFLKMSDPLATIPSGATATACTRLSLRRFPVRVDCHLPCLSVWTTAVEGRPSLDVSLEDKTDAETGTSFSFHVAIIAKDSYEIRDDSNQIVPGLPPSPYDLEENADFVLDILEHLAQFKWLKGLTNHRLIAPGHPFQDMFSVNLVNPSGRVFQPGCIHSGHFHPWCSHSECVVEVKHGEKVRLNVKNEQSPNGHKLHLHVYEMGSCWEIENLLDADYFVIPPQSSNQHVRDYRYGTTGLWSKKIRMRVSEEQIEKGDRQCEDIFKIFLTILPTSFLALEIPKLGRATKQHSTSAGRGDDPDSLSEDWAVLSFRIRTSLI